MKDFWRKDIGANATTDTNIVSQKFTTFSGFQVGQIVAPTNEYRTVQSGIWPDVNNWETYDGIAWVPATQPPSVLDSTITIRSGHTIFVLSNLTIDELVVENSGSLSTNNVTVTVNDGPGVDVTFMGGAGLLGTWHVNTGASIDGSGQVNYYGPEVINNGYIGLGFWDMDANANQTLSGTGKFKHLLLNTLSGTTLTSDMHVEQLFNINNGILHTGNFTLIFDSGATAQNNGNGDDWIDGNMQQYYVAGNSSALFLIGDNVDYYPISLTVGATVGGRVRASALAGDDVSIITSNIDAAKRS